MIFQEPFLNQLRIEQALVSVFLVSGVRLSGTIESFDAQIILLRGEDRERQGLQMIYKHSISSIVPQQEIDFPSSRPGGQRHAPRRNSHYNNQENRDNYQQEDYYDDEPPYRGR